jgi:hypothetical protein
MAVIESKSRRKGTTRYSVRVQEPGGKIRELAIDVNPEALTRLAKEHHDQHGWRVWVWNVRTGETLFEINAPAVQKAGAR